MVVGSETTAHTLLWTGFRILSRQAGRIRMAQGFADLFGPAR